jgi:hypothetical protein
VAEAVLGHADSLGSHVLDAASGRDRENVDNEG